MKLFVSLLVFLLLIPVCASAELRINASAYYTTYNDSGALVNVAPPAYKSWLLNAVGTVSTHEQGGFFIGTSDGFLFSISPKSTTTSKRFSPGLYHDSNAQIFYYNSPLNVGSCTIDMSNSFLIRNIEYVPARDSASPLPRKLEALFTHYCQTDNFIPGQVVRIRSEVSISIDLLNEVTMGNSISLNPGWNLVTLTHQPLTGRVEDSFPNSDLDGKLYRYIASRRSLSPFYSDSPEDFAPVQLGEGFFIQNDENTVKTLQVSGINDFSSLSPIPLDVPGLHLIGVIGASTLDRLQFISPTGAAMTFADALNSGVIHPSATFLNSTTGTYESVDLNINAPSTVVLKAGEAFYLRVIKLGYKLIQP